MDNSETRRIAIACIEIPCNEVEIQENAGDVCWSITRTHPLGKSAASGISSVIISIALHALPLSLLAPLVLRG